MINRYIFFILIFGLISGFKADWNWQGTPILPPYGSSPADTFPLPPADKNMLFYLQRTPNTNTVIYELNIKPDGTLDKDEPVHVYWIRYTEGGVKKELDFIQRKFAYGIKHELLDKEKGSYVLKMAAYDKREIFLIQSERTHQYKAYMSINGKMNEISRIYLQIEGGSFWFPNVVYIELTGHEIGTGKTVVERFKP